MRSAARKNLYFVQLWPFFLESQSYMKRVPKDVDLGKDFQSNTVITPILASNRPENLQGASSSILLAGTKI